MDKIKVLLADSSVALLGSTALNIDRNANLQTVGTVSDGAEVYQAVTEKLPDVLVMDIILPRCDGFMVMEQLARLPAESRPKIIVLTSMARDDFIINALKLGAAYFMAKPFDIQLLCRRIRETASAQPDSAHIPTEPANSDSADEQITNLFLTLGIPAHIKGYQYLREAVRMVIDDNSLTGSITKQLYPGVAQRFGTTASKVERAMRHAIEVAWNRGRLESANRMYGHHFFEKQDKPTNGEFISCVAEKINTSKSA